MLGGKRRRGRAGRCRIEKFKYRNRSISGYRTVLKAEAGQRKRRIDEMARCIEASKTDVTVIAMQGASLASDDNGTVILCGES